ncbi:MAG: adenylate/guanylate cyclase domain-containing protein [Acidimicrobiales bacterium]|nr:adenylate/guanylate cyclase domain-containing protein [Acidimicrobiales bacterium]
MSDVGDADRAEMLRLAGVTESEIERATADGTLGLRAIEAMILTDLHHDIDDIVRETGLATDRLRSLWGNLGFAEPRPGEQIFNDTDVELLRDVAELIDSDVADADVVIQLTRIIGASMARIANLQADLVVSSQAEDDEVAGTGLLWFGDMFGLVLEQVWRRHLQAAVRARLSSPVEADSETADQAVGFADLVGFTAMSQQLDASTLAGVVDRFESVAYATVNEHGGRVVKMIGDEVMFAIDDPVAAAHCAVDLAESYHEADDLSDVRVGVAHGPVIDRDGDLFGPTVNLASRMTGIAYPGSVLVDERLRQLIENEGDPGELVFRAMRPRRLKHLGLVRVHVLRRADEDDARRRERRERRRARVVELTQGLLPGMDDAG